MHEFYEIIKELVNPESIIRYGGLTFLLFIIFAETGLFFGFFLPGDSLLFTAGLFCSNKILDINIFFLIILTSLAAILGNSAGYYFGKKTGTILLKRKSTFFFKQSHLLVAQDFYKKHGGSTIIICRFLPIVRTFAPIVSGIVKQDFRVFMLYNFLGAFLWVGSLVSCGYLLGVYIPGINCYLEYIIMGLIVITTIPLIFKIKKSMR